MIGSIRINDKVISNDNIPNLEIRQKWGGRTVVLKNLDGTETKIGKINDVIKQLSVEVEKSKKNESAVKSSTLLDLHKQIAKLDKSPISSKFLHFFRSLGNSGRDNQLEIIRMDINTLVFQNRKKELNDRLGQQFNSSQIENPSAQNPQSKKSIQTDLNSLKTNYEQTKKSAENRKQGIDTKADRAQLRAFLKKVEDFEEKYPKDSDSLNSLSLAQELQLDKIKELRNEFPVILSPKKLKACEAIFSDMNTNLSKIQKGLIEAEFTKIKKENPNHTFEINGRLHVVSKMEKGQEMLIAKQMKFIAEGTFKEVYNVKYLGNQNIPHTVMAIAKKNMELYGSKEDQLNETRLLGKIHKDGYVDGIQDQPLVTGDGISLIPKYEIDGADLMEHIKSGEITLTADQKAEYTNKVSSGLTHIHEKCGIFQGDIKPQNMLYGLDPEGKKTLVLSDFGGSREFETLKFTSFPTLGDIYGTHTPVYCSANLAKEIDNILASQKNLYDQCGSSAEKEKFLSDMVEQQIKPLLMKSDQCSLGLALYEMWTGTPRDLVPFVMDPTARKMTIDREGLIAVEGDLRKANLDQATQDKIYNLIAAGISNPSHTA